MTKSEFSCLISPCPLEYTITEADVTSTFGPEKRIPSVDFLNPVTRTNLGQSVHILHGAARRGDRLRGMLFSLASATYLSAPYG